MGILLCGVSLNGPVPPESFFRVETGLCLPETPKAHKGR